MNMWLQDKRKEVHDMDNQEFINNIDDMITSYKQSIINRLNNRFIEIPSYFGEELADKQSDVHVEVEQAMQGLYNKVFIIIG